MITSRTNPKIKYVRRLQADKRFRSSQNAFVVEGTRWLREFVGKLNQPQQVFFTDAWSVVPNNAQILAQIGGSRQIVSDQVMQAMSATETAPGVLAVVDIVPAPFPKTPSFILILDGVSDPGNMGTLLRTAAAAGVEGVILTPNCVDVYNPKVTRSSMGAQIRLPIIALKWPQIAQLAKDLTIRVAKADGTFPYTRVNWQQPAALVIGNEAHGVTEEAEQIMSESIYIPLASGVESLNAAVAGSIIMFEVVRQRNIPMDNR